MALTLQLQYAANIANGATQVLTPTTQATKNILIKNVMVTNLHSSPVTVDLKQRLGGAGANSYLNVSPVALSIAAGAQVVFDHEFTLNLNFAYPDALEIIVGSGSSGVDCVVNGLSRDV